MKRNVSFQLFCLFQALGGEEGSFQGSVVICRYPWQVLGALLGMLPLLGHWQLGSGLGLQHKDNICSFGLLTETLSGGFLCILCVAWGEVQPRRQNKGKHQVDAKHMHISCHKTTVLCSLISSLIHTAILTLLIPAILQILIFSPAFLQLEVLILFFTIWLLFLLPFGPAKHLDSFNKSSFRSNISYAALSALGIKQKSALSSHFLLTFPVFFLSYIVSCFSLLSSSAANSVFIAQVFLYLASVSTLKLVASQIGRTAGVSKSACPVEVSEGWSVPQFQPLKGAGQVRGEHVPSPSPCAVLTDNQKCFCSREPSQALVLT